MDDSRDPERREDINLSTDDPELEKIREDTAEIFYHFVRLQSQSSSNAAAADRLPPDSPVETTTVPCLQPQESSRTLSGGPTPLLRSKSREAHRKDPHPKVVLSTRSSAQIVPSHLCSVEQPEQKTAGNPVSLSNSAKPRPDKLTLVQKHKLVSSSQSATGSYCSGKTTPAQDPPLELVSPELSSSYPPMSMTEPREGLVHSAEHAGATRSVAAVSASCTTSQERERHHASAQIKTDPRIVKARMIADRLKVIGDDLEDEYIKSKFEDLTSAISDVVRNQNTFQALFHIQSNLSWRKVAELFKLLYRVMETTDYDDQYTLFEKVWYCLLDSVVPWIQDRGGWSALPRETEPRLVSTPNVIRRSPPLNSARSEPVLPQSPTIPHCHSSYLMNGASTFSRIPMGGRMAQTPQMMRHHLPPPSREQSSPCLPRDRSNSQHSQPESSSQGRTRLWSLTESGRFKREEDGLEDIEQSISELDMTEKYDDEAFAASQEEVVEEEGDDSHKKTLTRSSLQSGFHASSHPIIVPSPHSSSQPETTSMDEFHMDSGIETSSLSLSCSPGGGVNFTLGGVSCRLSSGVHGHNQTSLTSLCSVASASPVHTSPSSRKNSSNGNGSGYFSDGKTRPRSGGSLKESRQKHSEDSPACYRTGSLTNRHHSRHHRPATRPTNEMPSQSAASGHRSWMETPVRHMSASAAVIYELVKEFFGSP